MNSSWGSSLERIWIPFAFPPLSGAEWELLHPLLPRPLLLLEEKDIWATYLGRHSPPAPHLWAKPLQAGQWEGREATDRKGLPGEILFVSHRPELQVLEGPVWRLDNQPTLWNQGKETAKESFLGNETNKQKQATIQGGMWMEEARMVGRPHKICILRPLKDSLCCLRLGLGSCLAWSSHITFWSTATSPQLAVLPDWRPHKLGTVTPTCSLDPLCLKSHMKGASSRLYFSSWEIFSLRNEEKDLSYHHPPPWLFHPTDLASTTHLTWMLQNLTSRWRDPSHTGPLIKEQAWKWHYFILFYGWVIFHTYRDCHIEWSKTDKDNIIWYHSYVKSKEMVQMNLFIKQK